MRFIQVNQKTMTVQTFAKMVKIYKNNLFYTIKKGENLKVLENDKLNI